jgi:hypothetical protein
MDDRGSIPGKDLDSFLSRHRVQSGSGAHQASYPMSTGSSLPGDKAAGASG